MNDLPDSRNPTTLSLDQSHASANGDVIGGNKTDNRRTYHYAERRSQIDLWMEKLQDEMENNEQINDFVESLQFYREKFAYDGVEGLEKKLEHAGRSSDIVLALRKKEYFEKRLEKYGHYASAQEIFALFLSQIENCFNAEIAPNIETMTAAELDKAIKEKVVDPAFESYSGGAFLLDYNHFYGMVFWLAEQCFVRWHK